MKLKIKNGMVYNEDDTIIAVMTDSASQMDERSIELGSEAIPLIENFIEQVNSGSFKPRKLVKTFEAIIEKHEI